MASNSADDDEIPSLNSIPPPDEGGVEEVTRVGSHAEIQQALEAEKPKAPIPAPGENIKTPTVPLPAVEIDSIAKVDDASGNAGGKKKNAVEELEDSALAEAAPSRPPPGAPPLPAAARKAKAKAEASSATTPDTTGKSITKDKAAPAKSNTGMIVGVVVVVAILVAFFASR